MTTTTWLIDKSAYARLTGLPDGAPWDDRIERGLVRITSLTRLEIGFSARSAHQMEEDAGGPIGRMPIEYLTPAVEDRAIEVQRLLAERGLHRAPSVPDLLVSAAAEMGGLTVLHVDQDFELIAELTGQPVERLEVTAQRFAAYRR